MSTTAQTYWQSSAEKWEGQRNCSLKNEVHKDAISCFSIWKDWGFAVRAKSFALHWRSRGFFSGSRAQLWERSMSSPLWYTDIWQTFFFLSFRECCLARQWQIRVQSVTQGTWYSGRSSMLSSDSWLIDIGERSNPNPMYRSSLFQRDF